MRIPGMYVEAARDLLDLGLARYMSFRDVLQKSLLKICFDYEKLVPCLIIVCRVFVLRCIIQRIRSMNVPS